MTVGTRWIFLSPHLDDAVLSCGGMIAEIAKTAHVEIWTIFTRAPLRGPYSNAAQWLHGISGGKTGSRLAALRRAEDRAACRVVGASAVHLPFVEAVYRRRSDGRFLYPAPLQGSIHPSDRALVERIAKELKRLLRPGDRIVAPLAIAGHADHIVTREAVHAVTDKDLVYYAEIPYLEARQDKVARLTASMWRLRFLPAAESLERWLSGTRRYKSQLAMLRGESGTIEEIIERYAGNGMVMLFTPTEQLARSVGMHEAFAMSPPAEPESSPERIAVYSDHATQPQWSEGPLAPVALFAYKRLGTLKRTLEALERCDGFRDTAVNVFCDNGDPAMPRDVALANALQKWIAKWCRQTGAEMHVTDGNLGLRRSIVSGVTSMLSQSESVIVLEDDIVTSPSFLVFMNQALQHYRARDDIMQVSGYFVPHSADLPTIGLVRAPGSWGWGTWRRAWQHYSDDASALVTDIGRLDTNAFDLNGSYPYFETLRKNAEGTLDTWAVRWYASMFRRGGLALYPALSFTRNIGFGTDATNTTPTVIDRVYSRQRIRRRTISPQWESVGPTETQSYVRELERFYRWQNQKWAAPSMRERIRGSVANLRARSSGS
jgi:LmbE family N-acetylglucosaminyl deacetylase